MKFMGSKDRHGEEIFSSILINLKDRPHSQIWVEPFVGGANMIDKMPANWRKYGNDSNFYLIELFKAIQTDWIPPEIVTNEDYNLAKKYSINEENAFSPALIGFIGFGCSFGAKWFGGYARGKNNNGESRNYAAESKRNILKQKDNILDVSFTCLDYKDLIINSGSVVYCDPPYAGTTKYKENFNHKEFWRWCDELVLKGCLVFVSEYNAPPDWQCIWEKKTVNSFDHNRKPGNVKTGIEKLFTKYKV